MDIQQLVDLTERLLILYGYEVERDVGISGATVTTADLTREIEVGGKTIQTETEERAPIIYKVDIFAEKKDLERPFGRIVVMYNRSNSKVNVSQITHLNTVRKVSDSYLGLMLSLTGIDDEAAEHAKQNNIEVFTPERIEQLIGKAMAQKPWWQSVNAYPVRFAYSDAVRKIKHTVIAWFQRSWDVSKVAWSELAYMPYWKFNYSVIEKDADGNIASPKPLGTSFFNAFAINAYDGMIDLWWDYDPIELMKLANTPENKKRGYENAVRGFVPGDAYLQFVFAPFGTPGKVSKPKGMPPGVRFQVYKPAIEKWEAKVVATQWLSYFWDTDPKNIQISAIELCYFPWWRFRIENLPYIKNAWNEVEYINLQVSGLMLDVFNLYKNVPLRKNIVFLMAEKYMVNLLGPKKYTKLMNRVTYNFLNRILYWKFGIRASYRWIDLLFFALFLGMVYGMLVFKTGIMLLVFIGLLFVFIGPGYAFLYLMRDYLMLYPWGKGSSGKKYGHPFVTKKEAILIGKKAAKEMEKVKALDELQTMYEAGELDAVSRRRFEAYMDKKAHTKLKDARKAV
ncbi:MAG: restriction endonuclease [archaeon]